MCGFDPHSNPEVFFSEKNLRTCIQVLQLMYTSATVKNLYVCELLSWIHSIQDTTKTLVKAKHQFKTDPEC